MSRYVICPYCKIKFDRDKEQYSPVGSRRYAHAACMLREAEKDPSYVKKEIIDPNDIVKCCVCKLELSKKDNDCEFLSNGKYCHSKCKTIEEQREKTDEEKLEEYIKKLFNTNYVEPKVKLQIKRYVEEYNYTYSGIHKALYYFYEIKGGDLSKANGRIGIVPYVYRDAYNYYYNLWLNQQKNKDIEITLYVPKVKEVKISRPQRKIKKPSLFTFLEEDE